MTGASPSSTLRSSSWRPFGTANLHARSNTYVIYTWYIYTLLVYFVHIVQKTGFYGIPDVVFGSFRNILTTVYPLHATKEASVNVQTHASTPTIFSTAVFLFLCFWLWFTLFMLSFSCFSFSLFILHVFIACLHFHAFHFHVSFFAFISRYTPPFPYRLQAYFFGLGKLWGWLHHAKTELLLIRLGI